ncbi:MAG: 2-oxo acid dehydrogenase subunit E2 [Chlorobi bacterium]|nr:2-oxo acid dehydrogenase subunit E2 [Chlorobiota bacterium]
MGLVNIALPRMGEAVEEATITRWFAEAGQEVKEDDVLVEVATDKVDSEIPAPVSGVVSQINFSEGDVVKVGEVMAVISTGGDDTGQKTEEKEKIETKELEVEPVMPVSEENEEKDAQTDITVKNSNIFLSPLVRSIAAKEDLTSDEFAKIKGSGRNGRITKDDIKEYLKNRGKEKTENNLSTTEQKSLEKAKVNISGNDEVVKMDRMRKLIADHMLMSKQVSPHVTSVVETDVTNIVLWRNKNKDTFLKKYGVKLTYMPVFTEAVAKALRDFPGVNASVDGDSIIIKKSINIGMAVVLPSGNLIVPVIKNADTMNIAGLSRSIANLAERARTNKLTPDDIEGGTFTVTNVGTFGNIMGTPIINQPQVAILATGVIEKKPAVIETPTGDMIAIRHKMYLSLSYDHRVVDGALGGGFLKRISDYLEDFDMNSGI